MKRWWVRMVAAGIAFFLTATLLLSLVVMFLWNALVPSLFRGPSLTFVQAVGLLILTHILLRGWSPWRHGNGWRRHRWRKRVEESLAVLTPEDRERLREEWHRRCTWDPASHPGGGS
jgi:hypothetical protein